MQVALLPGVAADVKRAAEEVLIGRMGSVTSGERFTLAKQASGRVAAALLLDKEERILRAALDNARMTEMYVAKALKGEAGTELLAPAVARHQKWSYRLEVKAALLANRNTPLARAIQIANELPMSVLKDLLSNVRLTPGLKAHMRAVVEKRAK